MRGWLAERYRCPRCGGDELEAVSDGTQTNFLCRACWVCWHIELGYMAPVPVSTCPGCPHKAECLVRRPPPRAREDHDAFTSPP
jgi:hypothetical protein